VTAHSSPSAGRVVRVGCGQGFLGEDPELMRAVLADGVDYIVCESLAERTMGLLEQARQQDEAAGFTPDLVDRVEIAADAIVSGRTRLITNGGGVNAPAALRAVVARLRSLGLTGCKVGLVLGDAVAPADVAPEPLAGRARSASVYLGAAGIVSALEQGADIVITGRVADACLFLAPLVHEHGWSFEDWDRLAAGVVVGHLLECSAQSTGGNYSGDWWNTVDPWRAGLPIAEVAADGSAIITKPRGSSGRVSFDTVREQLLYEVHDPRRYLTPDVVVDMTSVRVDDLGDDRVRVSAAQGAPRPETLKGIVFSDGGFAGEANLTYAWPDAPDKARFVLAAIQREAQARELPVQEWCVEYFGVDGFGGPTVGVSVDADPPEVIGRLAWRTTTASAAQSVAALVRTIALTGPPGLQGIGRRPSPPGPIPLLVLDDVYPPRGPIEAGVRVHVEEV
jgi:acyclic terpene utilization AtuA family protein